MISKCLNDSLALVFSSRPIKMSPRFVLGRENVPCVAEVVNRSLKADCTDFTSSCPGHLSGVPTVLQSTSSCPKYLRLSRVPLVVESTSICREHLQLSKVPPFVESTSSCPKYLHLSRAPPVVQSTFSCRE